LAPAALVARKIAAVKTRYTFTIELGHSVLAEAISIKFATNGDIAVQEGKAIVPLHVENFEVEIILEPETDERRAGEWAKLHVTVRGTPEKFSPFVERVAAEVAEHLAFYYDGLRLLGGMIFAERIPENEEERAAIGDTPHSVKASFIEADPPRSINREHLRSFPYSLGFGRLLRQFAAARASDNTIDSYLNMFKVVETLYHRGKLKARDALNQSEEFRRLLRGSFQMVVNGKPEEPTEEDVTAMIDRLVKTRDNCAHLREHNSFGYAPGDPEVGGRVQRLYEILTDTARAAIHERIDAKRSTVSATASDGA
jgi:hypothetical protein